MPGKHQTDIRKRANPSGIFGGMKNSVRKAVAKAKKTKAGKAAMMVKDTVKAAAAGDPWKNARQANTRAHAARRPTIGIKPKVIYKPAGKGKGAKKKTPSFLQ